MQAEDNIVACQILFVSHKLNISRTETEDIKVCM